MDLEKGKGDLCGPFSFCQKEMVTGQNWQGKRQVDPGWAFVHCFASISSSDLHSESKCPLPHTSAALCSYCAWVPNGILSVWFQISIDPESAFRPIYHLSSLHPEPRQQSVYSVFVLLPLVDISYKLHSIRQSLCLGSFTQCVLRFSRPSCCALFLCLGQTTLSTS